MREIYTCRVDFDDQLEVMSDDSRHMGFNTSDNRASVFLNREDVARLRDALTAWLGDGETGVTVRVHLTDKRILEIIRDELASRIPVPARPIKASLLTEEAAENIWGRPCATCGHSTGVHLPVLGCEHPDRCECAWPDTSAPAPEKCDGCTCPAPHRTHDPVAGCVECLCKWTGSASAPESARAPECGCTHRAERHGPEAGCVECLCKWTGSAP